MTINLDSMRMGDHRARRRARRVGVAALLLAMAWTALAPASAGAVDYDGAGYRVYVCKAAADRGYPAPLNRAFYPTFSETIPGTTDLRQWRREDTCDNWKRGVPGHLSAWYRPNTGRVYLPPSNKGREVGASWQANIGQSTGLAITRINQQGRLAAVAGYTTPYASHMVRFGMGNTIDPPPLPRGYHGYYGCTATAYTMTPIAGDAHNPDLVPYSERFCYRTMNDTYRFNPVYGPTSLSFGAACATTFSTPQYCRSDDPADPTAIEPGLNNNWGIELTSATLYVQDDRNPGLTMSPAPTGDGDPDRNVDGVPDETKERFVFDAWDNAGLRRIDFFVDGRLVTRRAFRCVHMYMAPCPWSKGAPGPPWGADVSPFEFDVDQLDPAVPHTATIVVIDGSGRVSRAIRPIRVTTRAAQQMQCQTTGPTSLITTLLVPATCQTLQARPEQDASSDSADSVLVGAAPAPTPTSGDAIFQYDLAANAFPTKRPLNPGDCRTLNAVMRGSGAGGSLSNTEMNQIITVTIDLNAFFQSTELGQQSTKTTFSLPARSTARYRSALGCAG